MSHIYEALQRAEAERKSGAQTLETPIGAGAPEPGVFASAAAARAVWLRLSRTSCRLPPRSIHPFWIHPFWIPCSGSHGRRPSIACLRWKEEAPAWNSSAVCAPASRSFATFVRLKTILISSGLPQEGKSFIAVNLAINLARHKSSKVLLIDGDMRCSSLHHYLGSEFNPGLSDYLSGKASLPEVMQLPAENRDRDPSMAAVLNNITFIPGGDGGDQAADLSASKRFDELLTAVAPLLRLDHHRLSSRSAGVRCREPGQGLRCGAAGRALRHHHLPRRAARATGAEGFQHHRVCIECRRQAAHERQLLLPLREQERIRPEHGARMIKLLNVYYPTRTVVLILCEALIVGGSFVLASAIVLGADTFNVLGHDHGDPQDCGADRVHHSVRVLLRSL